MITKVQSIDPEGVGSIPELGTGYTCISFLGRNRIDFMNGQGTEGVGMGGSGMDGERLG